MPGMILGFTSGGTQLISGVAFSGQRSMPVGGVHLAAWRSNSGDIFVGLSGGITVLSGTFALSGAGLLDGVPLRPGETYFIPKLALPTSGTFNIFVAPEAACSGQARIFWELF